MRFALLLLVVACGSSKPASSPSDVGACRPFDHDGKPYYLCERTGQAKTPAEGKPSATDSERVREAELARDWAQREADEATKAARDAIENFERLAKDLEELDKRVTIAVDSMVAAQNDADRANARARLDQLRREKAEMDAKLAAARARAAKAQRMKGQPLTKECQDNPLAKGCF